ncbi:helix-turn-helix domain-containing protein [Alsobacter sp. R-9]
MTMLLPYGNKPVKRNLPYGSGTTPGEDQSAAMAPPRIRHYRKQLALTLEQLAHDVGISVSQLSRAERGGRDLKLNELRKVADRLGVTVSDLVEGFVEPANDDRSTVRPAGPVVALPVSGEVAAGLWMETDVWDEGKYDPIPHVAGRYAGLEQRAWHVSGNSMDLEGIVDGSFVVTVPYFDARGRLTPGDICVIERRRGGLIERTCKKIDLVDGHYELQPCSSDPKWKAIVVNRKTGVDADGVEVEVVGYVIFIGRTIGS